MTRPPQLGEALLRLLLPPGLSRESILGDLEAGFHRDRKSAGRFTSVVRYWGAVLSVSARYVLARGTRLVRQRGQRTPVHEALGDSRARGLATVWDSLHHDVAYALRTLAREPGWTAATLATLILGIGATAAIFTVVDGVLLRRLDFPAPGHLMVMEYRPADQATATEWAGFDNYRSEYMPHHVNYAAFEAWRNATTDVFSDVGAYDDAWTHDVGFGPQAGTERLAGTFATSGIFRALRVPPLRGRLFTDADDRVGAPPVVLLSYPLWVRRFGADPGVVGRQLTVDNELHTVVGVMPRGFAFPSSSAALWISMATASRGPGSTNYKVLGRIRDGLSPAQARAAMKARTITITDPKGVERRFGAGLETLRSSLVGDVRPLLTLFMSAVVVLLLIACVNVVNLMLTRATRRTHERVVRAALGASPGQLTLHILTEGVTVSLLGAVLGGAMAYAVIGALLRWAPSAFPREDAIGMDGTVILFSVGLAVVVGVAVAVAPALRASRTGLATHLNDSARGASAGAGQGRLRDALVVVQLALAFMLLVGGGLLARSLATQLREEKGFNANGVLTFATSLPQPRYGTPAEANQFYDRLLNRLRAVPGVRSVAAVTYVPSSGWFDTTDFDVEGDASTSDEKKEAEYLQVTPGYYGTMGIAMVSGRDFDAHDDASAPRVVAVSESLARSWFPRGDAVGRLIQVDGKPSTIVAVIGDTWYRGSKHRAPVIYQPYAQSTRHWGRAVMVKVDGNPLRLAPSVPRLVANMDPEVTVYGVRPLQSVLWRAVSGPRLRAVIVGGFALTSLLLSLVGVYGVMAYAVSRRTRELGIRRALGARPRGIVRQVVLRGMALAVLGIVLGVAGAYPATRALRAYLYQLDPRDPVTLVGATVVLGLASLAACLLPALRAARVDPLVALRDE